jgi:hypothetical protein
MAETAGIRQRRINENAAPARKRRLFRFLQIATTATADPERRRQMQMGPNTPTVKPERKTLRTRRFLRSLSVECEGHTYRATAGWFDDGQLAEIFLDTGKFGTALQANADTAAILTSLLLQHGVAPDVILHSITGPIAIALRLFMDETP